MGSCGGSTYIALHQTWLVSADLPCGFGAQVCVSYFSCATFRTSPWRSFCQFPCLLRFHTSYLPWVQFLGLLPRRVAGWTLCPPPLSSWILSFAWTYSPDSLILLHPAIDFVAVSLSPSLTYALTPGHCVPLGGFHVLVGSSTYPSLGRMLGPSSIGLWLCWRLGCRPVPSSHFLGSVSYLACSLDSCSYGFLR